MIIQLAPATLLKHGQLLVIETRSKIYFTVEAKVGNVNIEFSPEANVFDANISLGRRHSTKLRVDGISETLALMDFSRISRALAYNPHAVSFDGLDGNSFLIEEIENHRFRIEPQFVWSPGIDSLSTAIAQTALHKVKSIRMTPISNNYVFKPWVVSEWLEWLSSESIPLWLPVEETDPGDIFETVVKHPKLKLVLTEVHYKHYPWVMHLLKALPNLYIETSRFVVIDGIRILVDAIGSERILYGSRFPYSPFSPMLYSIHLSDLNPNQLNQICHTNLENLLKDGK